MAKVGIYYPQISLTWLAVLIDTHSLARIPRCYLEPIDLVVYQSNMIFLEYQRFT